MASSTAEFNQMASAIREIKNKKKTSHHTRKKSVADTTARQVPSVAPVRTYQPSASDFFVEDLTTNHKVPNASYLKTHFFEEGRLTEEQALWILDEATRMLTREPNLLEVNGSTIVCGDIHGQYYDLLKLFEVGGSIADNKYLFLGDYVDRGLFGIECLLYLYALKLQHPTSIYLLRGNHECKHLTEFFTFKRECLHKYSLAVYSAALKSFQALPIAAVLDNRFFCVHGGLSPELNTLSDVKKLDRFREPGSHGLLCDLLWSDPAHNFGESSSHSGSNSKQPGFMHNETRGCSYYFTYEATCQFLERNKLLSVIRGHEAQDQGYQMYTKTPRNFPSLITIFSAPNYLDAYQNRAAVLKYVNKNIVLRQFNASPHPFWLPGFLDAFTWSLPFVGSKIAEMFLAILSICTDEELTISSSEDEAEDAALASIAMKDEGAEAERREKIRNKVLAVGKMARAFKMMREEAENISELRTYSGGFDIEPGASAAVVMPQIERNILGVSGQNIVRQITGFNDARRFDIDNERLPVFPPTGSIPMPTPQIPGSATAPTPTDIEATFPAPSMRQASSLRNPGAFLRRIGGAGGEEEEDQEIRTLADRVARIPGWRTKSATRPVDQLKRFGTV